MSENKKLVTPFLNKMSENKKLSEKEECFCREYIKHLNARRAAEDSGYSKKSARQLASRLLSKVNIKERIQELKDKRAEKTEITSERVVNELAKIGFSDELTLEGFTKLELKDKLKALEMLGRHTGAFNNDESGKTVLKVKVGND